MKQEKFELLLQLEKAKIFLNKNVRNYVKKGVENENNNSK